MEECELCGRKMSTAYIISIENVKLRVCEKCSNDKKVLFIDNGKEKADSANKYIENSSDNDEIEQIIDDYGETIRRARESMGLSLKVLAELLNEKESFLARIEKQKTTPNSKLIEKLEKTLNIKLIENP
ncbi:MAG: multiprotein-bridging factor 1 family protein [Candidatus Marsarchaeota archaeon]|nr:multiprotein-bridging factor 1 family protein [Candidatus Marsarchaeota archaeon]MCL5094411.1 multiprotein-bridging factor 1 family protein [Candidatus Marsarchaeota archaeon]